MLTRLHVKTSLVAIASVFALVAAKGEGCVGPVEPVEPPPEPPACLAGFHLESVCDPTIGSGVVPGDPGEAQPPDEGGGSCYDECVPDEPCPQGTRAEWVCEAWADPGMPPPPPCDPSQGDCVPPCDPSQGDCPPPPPPPCDPSQGDCPPPPEPSCELVCVPEAPCPPGFHAEFWCGEPEPLPIENDPSAPPPPPPCDLVCLPDPICPPGTVEQPICAEPAGDGVAPPEPCFIECVPLCPEGTVGQIICAESIPGGCWTECIPVELCPPGTIEQTVCEGFAPPEPGDGSEPPPPPPPPVCYTECVPEPLCPPGQHPEHVCHDLPAGDGPHDCCEPVCVDDVVCDPTLFCGEALTCLDGLLFPTTCGPANCDAPLGPCPMP